MSFTPQDLAITHFIHRVVYLYINETQPYN